MSKLGLTVRSLAVWPLLAFAVDVGPALAEQWTATDMLAYISAASWCNKEEGMMTEEESLAVSAEVISMIQSKYGYTVEQLGRILSEKDFAERGMKLIRYYGGCRGFLREVKRRASY